MCAMFKWITCHDETDSGACLSQSRSCFPLPRAGSWDLNFLFRWISPPSACAKPRVSGAEFFTVTPLIFTGFPSFYFPLLLLLFHWILSVSHSPPSVFSCRIPQVTSSPPLRSLSAREPKGFYNARAQCMADTHGRACTREGAVWLGRQCSCATIPLLLNTHFTLILMFVFNIRSQWKWHLEVSISVWPESSLHFYDGLQSSGHVIFMWEPSPLYE